MPYEPLGPFLDWNAELIALGKFKDNNSHHWEDKLQEVFLPRRNRVGFKEAPSISGWRLTWQRPSLPKYKCQAEALCDYEL